MKKLLFYRWIAYISAIFIIIFAYYGEFKFIQKVSYNFSDYKFKLREKLGYSIKANENVVVVDIDEESINKIGRWPWNRNITAELISKLSDASVVALDILFSEKSDEKSDKLLADTIAENNNVVLGYFFREKATENVSDEVFERIDEYSIFRVKSLSNKVDLKEFSYVEGNIREISDAAMSSAFFSIEQDIDGLYRNYPIAYIYKGKILPSIGFQSLRFYFDKDLEMILDKKGINKLTLGDISINKRNYIRLNYYDDVKYISANKILSNQVDKKFFKGKIVVIGITEKGIFDLRPTPVDPVTPGVSLHYTLISNIMNGEYLNDSKVIDVALILISSLMVIAISFFRKIYLRVFSYAVFISAVIVISNILFIKEFIWIKEFYPIIGLLLPALIYEIFAFLIVDIKALEIRKAFATYVSPYVVELMLKEPDRLKLGGENREVTVIFSDIRGFTSISEKISSEQVVYILNQLNSPLTDAIIRNGGLLDKYIGDAIMAIYNAPVDIEGHSDRACETALEMMKILGEINSKFHNEGLPAVDIGIGINTGVATVGNIGSNLRFDYTAIGDSVNLASRLEGLNKMYKTHIIISEFTKQNLKKHFLIRQIDNVVVKGKDKPVAIFEILEDNETNREMVRLFDYGFQNYLKGDFITASDHFKSIFEKYLDQLSEVYIHRCSELISSGVNIDWDGVYVAKSK